MSMMDGISQCSPLSSTCHVWWDAWAVLVAVLAVGATLFLGFMTLRLGREANKAAGAAARASEAAVEIASEDRGSRLRDAEDRRVMLLVWIAGEVSGALTILRRNLSDHSEDAKSRFLKDAQHRHFIRRLVLALNFPNAVSMAGSLHAIGHPVAARFARTLALVTMMKESFALGEIPDNDAEAAWGMITTGVPRLIPDLEAVHEACVAAAVKAGIRPAAVD